jgi:hypothetical protein
MLGKLFKHEMKACSRLLLPLYLLLFVLTILDRIVLGLNVFHGVLGIIAGILTFIFIFTDVVIAVVSLVIVIMRFYKNLITDEGYLMFTLPVKTNQLINSKLLAASIWTIVSALAMISSMFIVFSSLTGASAFWNELTTQLSLFKDELGSSFYLFLIGIVLGIVFTILNSILHIYASIAIGQLFSGHKILGSVVAYAAIGAVMQVVFTLASIISVFIIGKEPNDFTIATNALMPVSLFITILFTVAFYWITSFLFRRKLNLE